MYFLPARKENIIFSAGKVKIKNLKNRLDRHQIAKRGRSCFSDTVCNYVCESEVSKHASRKKDIAPLRDTLRKIAGSPSSFAVDTNLFLTSPLFPPHPPLKTTPPPYPIHPRPLLWLNIFYSTPSPFPFHFLRFTLAKKEEGVGSHRDKDNPAKSGGSQDVCIFGHTPFPPF